METAAKIYEEGKDKEVVQVNPEWVLEESLQSLSFKFPILPRSQGSLVFCSTLLSHKLEPKPDDALFDLSESNLLQYNVLHDPHLKEYFQNPAIRRRLIDQGIITEDGYVKCSLLEFNNYRKWIRRMKLEELYKQNLKLREEENIRRNKQLMEKKLQREKECLDIFKEREKKAREYVKRRKEKWEMDRIKLMRNQNNDMRRREKWKRERKNKLDDAEEERDKRQVERKVEKIIEEDKKRKIRFRIVRKRKLDDIRRASAIKERRSLCKWQREKELKKQWRRRCTIALGNITEHWKEEKRSLELRSRNIEERAKMFEKRQKNNQAAVNNFVKTRRATLHQEFLEAEEFLTKLRLKKDIEIANWKRKHEKMRSRNASIVGEGQKETSLECSEYMALRRWSAPDRMGFRRRLKSTWDLESSLIKDLEEESPSRASSKVDVDGISELKEYGEDTEPRASQLVFTQSASIDSIKKPQESNKVRSLIWNIINSAYDVFEEEKRRCEVKAVVADIINSAAILVENETRDEQMKTYVRRFVFSIIEIASQTLERERIEHYKAKLREETTSERNHEQLKQTARELVSTAMVFAKRIVDKEIRKPIKDEKNTAKWIVDEAIERAYDRYYSKEIRRVSSENLPEDVRMYTKEWDYESSLDWAVRNIVSDAVATAVDSIERFYYKESDVMEAATGLMKLAIISAQESIEHMYRVTPALEEQINRVAWRLANRAMISAQNSLEALQEENITQTAQDLASNAILSAKTSFLRMEEQTLRETAEELALQAIISAQKSIRKVEEEEFFSEELAKRAILEAKKSLVRADQLECASRELARQAIETAQTSFEGLYKEHADEAKKIAVAAAERCIQVYKSQEQLTTQNNLIATEALNLAIQAIQSSVESLEAMQRSCELRVSRDGNLLSSVMQYVEGIIMKAIQELKTSKDIDVLKPGNVKHDEYDVVTHSEVDIPQSKAHIGKGKKSVEGDTFKAASSGRRRSSVHFNTKNVISNRRDSLSRESEFIPASNRPPTPRFLGRRTFSNQIACVSWDNLEQELKDIEEKDKVKVLISSREGSPKLSDIKHLTLRRFSSDQNISSRTRPNIVSFQIPHSASDSYFRCASGSQNIEEVKETLFSPKDSYTMSKDDDTKEHQECEFDTLVSMTNTPEPQRISDSEDQLMQVTKAAEKRIPSQITPKTSSYVLLPKLTSHEKILIENKVKELEQVHHRIEPLTHFPAVSPTTSLVMVQEDKNIEMCFDRQRSTSSFEERTNLPKISKSGSIVSIDSKIINNDQVQFESSRTPQQFVSESVLDTSTNQVSQVSPKESTKITTAPSIEAAEVTPKPSSIGTSVSTKTSMESIKVTPTLLTEVAKVTPKPSSKVAGVSSKSSVESTKVTATPSTEAAKVTSRPSSEVAKVSIEALSESKKLTPKPSTQKVTPSSEFARVSTKASVESVKVPPTPSTQKVTSKPSSEVAGVSTKTSMESTKVTATTRSTEAEKVTPKPSRKVATVSTKASVESTKVTPTPSTQKVTPSSEVTRVFTKTSMESTKVPPTPSTEVAKVTSKPSSEVAGVSTKPSMESTKVASTPSTEAAKVTPKPSRKVATVSTKASVESTNVTPTPSTQKVTPSSEVTRVFTKTSMESTKVPPTPSTEVAKETPKPSSEVAGVSTKTSMESTNVTPTPSTEAAKVTPKPSSEVARVSTKTSVESTKVTPTPSTDVAKVTPKPSSKVAGVSSKSSVEPTKVTATPSTEAAKVTPKPSSEVARVSTKASMESTNVTPTLSTEAAKVTPKPSSEVARVSTKTSMESTKVTPTPSTEAPKVTQKPSSKVATVFSKASVESIKITPTPSTHKVTIKTSTEVAGVSTKLSSESAKVTLTPSIKAVKVTPKPSSDIAIVSAKASIDSLKGTPKPSTQKVAPKTPDKGAGVLTKSSSSFAKMTSTRSSKAAKVIPQHSSEVAIASAKALMESTKVTPMPSTEAAKVTPKPSSEVAKVSIEALSESKKLTPTPSTPEVTPKSSNEVAGVSTKRSSESAKLTSTRSTRVAKVTPKPSSEVSTVSTKASMESTKVTPTTSVQEVTSKPSSEVAGVSSKVSSESAKVTTTRSTKVAKVTPKPSGKVAVVSAIASVESSNVTPRPSTQKVTPKTSDKVGEVSTKASVESTNVTPTPSDEVASMTPKHSSEVTKISIKSSRESTKVTSKPSNKFAKLVTKASSESTTVSTTSLTNDKSFITTTSSESSNRLSKASSESRKMKTEPSHESVRVSAKPSKKAAKLLSPASSKSTKLSSKPSKEIQLSSKVSTQSTKVATKPSHGKSIVSLKRSSESNLSPKVSKESNKKTKKHSRGGAKVSNKSLLDKSSSHSNKIVPKMSKKVAKVSQKSSSDVTKTFSKTSNEAAGVSPKVSYETPISKDVALKSQALSEATMSTEKVHKIKPTSLSLTKVSSKTGEKTQVSASESLDSSVPFPQKRRHRTSKGSETIETMISSLKSESKLEIPSSSNIIKGSSHELIPKIQAGDTKSDKELNQLQQKDEPKEEGDRRISLSVPDPVIALKGIGRRTSLPVGIISEEESNKSRLSSLQDLKMHETSQSSSNEDTIQQDREKDLKNIKKSSLTTLTVDETENRRISLIHSIPSITIQEAASPPNDDNVLFEEDERIRIINELERTHLVDSVEQKSTENINKKEEAENTTDEGEVSKKIQNLRNSSVFLDNIEKLQTSSVPDIYMEKKSDTSLTRRTSSDTQSPSQRVNDAPMRQSVTCIGIEFSPTTSKEGICSGRISEASMKTKAAKGSIGRVSHDNIGPRKSIPDSFELKGIGLGERSSSGKSLISSRSTEFPRTQPLPLGSRAYFSSHSLDTRLSRGVIVTPLKPSPPLSPRLIESSARRSRLKMALSQHRAKETKSETSLSSSKSDASEGLRNKVSETLFGSESSVSNSATSKESAKTLPERPNTASSTLKREKIKASRTITSSSSSEETNEIKHKDSNDKETASKLNVV